MRKKDLGEEHLFQITSGVPNKCCDVLPHGCLVKGREDLKTGIIWLSGKTDMIPPKFSYERVDYDGPTKECSGGCAKTFQEDWPFYGEKENSCLRCTERVGDLNRDELHMAIRKELLLEGDVVVIKDVKELSFSAQLATVEKYTCRSRMSKRKLRLEDWDGDEITFSHFAKRKRLETHYQDVILYYDVDIEGGTLATIHADGSLTIDGKKIEPVKRFDK